MDKNPANVETAIVGVHPEIAIVIATAFAIAMIASAYNLIK